MFLRLGIALTAYTLGLASISLASQPGTVLHLAEQLSTSSPVLFTAVKFALAFPISYHLCMGMRHLLWDSGKFLTIKEVYATGYAALAATVVLTSALMLL